MGKCAIIRRNAEILMLILNLFLICAPAELFRGKKRRNMDKFPEDVRTAEERTGGDPDIVKQYEKEPEARPNIASIFGDTSVKGKKGAKGRKRRTNSGSSDDTSRETTPARSHPGRFSHGGLLSTASRKSSFDDSKLYKCQFALCNFSTDRLNVIILHNKTHSNEKAPAMQFTRKCQIFPFILFLITNL